MTLIILAILGFLVSLCGVILLIISIIQPDIHTILFSVLSIILGTIIGIGSIIDYQEEYVALHQYEVIRMVENKVINSSFEELNIDIVADECIVFIKEGNMVYRIEVSSETYTTLKEGKTYEKTLNWFKNLGEIKEKAVVKE